VHILSLALTAAVKITPLIHSSVQIEYGDLVIQVDPWSAGDLSRLKPADLILITDDPIHHLDPKAIAQLRKPGAPVLLPPGAHSKFAEGTPIANGEKRTVAGVTVEAIPVDIKQGEPSHRKESNGCTSFRRRREASTSPASPKCVPEVRALRDIDTAFIPMSIPLDRMNPRRCVRVLQRSTCVTTRRASCQQTRHEHEATLQAFTNALADSAVVIEPGACTPRRKDR
jgi:L-ascorbate metabolism protein UlaG (beta-lactamase superfamily)